MIVSDSCNAAVAVSNILNTVENDMDLQESVKEPLVSSTQLTSLWMEEN